MLLDGSSLAFSSAASTLLFALAFGGIWLHRKAERHLALWGAGAGLISVALVIDTLALRHHTAGNDVLAVLLVVLLAGLGLGVVRQGVYVFDGVPGGRLSCVVLAAVPVLATAAGAASGSGATVASGMGIMSLALPACALVLALLRVPAGMPVTTPRRVAGAATALYTACLLAAGPLRFVHVPDGNGPIPVVLIADQILGLTLFGALVSMTVFRRHSELKDLATVDPLTRLPNRRAMDAALAALSTAAPGSVAVLMLDLDHFKRVNDTYGHATGDLVLVEMARRCGRVLGAARGRLYRAGGEEFLGLVGDTGTGERAAAHALEIAERLRRVVGETPFRAGPHALPVTVSIGVALGPPLHSHLEATVGQADAALYAAKKEGRNRVALARPPAPADAA